MRPWLLLLLVLSACASPSAQPTTAIYFAHTELFKPLPPGMARASALSDFTALSNQAGLRSVYLDAATLEVVGADALRDLYNRNILIVGVDLSASQMAAHLPNSDVSAQTDLPPDPTMPRIIVAYAWTCPGSMQSGSLQQYASDGASMDAVIRALEDQNPCAP